MSKSLFYQLPVLLLLGTLLASCQREGELRPALPDAPGMNVLVVSFDALRADALGLYGYERETSPNLDAFAAEALVFDRAYSSAPVTPTAFAGAFTGLHPYKVFVGWEMIPTTTLADVMSNAGYYTFALLNNVQLVTERHFDKGFELYDTGPWKDLDLLDLARSTLDEALEKDQPFFGWIHFINPHTPYDYREMSAHLAPPQEEGRFAERVPGSFEIESEAELKRVRDLYDAEVYFADHLFGALIDHLRQQGALDNTIILVTADHGEEFMDHGQVQHNALYEELVRIPMLIRHPVHAAGTRTDVPFVNIDMLPTIASIIGADVPGDLDGVDLRAPIDYNRHRIVTAMTNHERYEILSERGGKKLIRTCTPEYREELYDLASDPGEKDNLILDDPSLANQLDGLLQAALGTDPCALIRSVNQGKAPEDLLSPEQIEQLKSLGYIQ